ncbi:uncharacterized protein [Apostichopus japonicus]|uniref:uncharacterized protein n=1 Tax=Stichopus japonicus TaxID=307972 RepID=UPI003AB60C77
MLPWFFACDRVHYSRYLPVYWLEMKNLPESHPDVHENLSAGEFVVQRQDQFGFSQIACDQTIEQTCNRDTKTKGGLTGFTLNRGAVHRWILSSHERAAITKECQTMAGKFLHSRKKDLDKTRICKDEEHTNLVMATVESMINPFEPDQHQLVNISSGVVATDDVCEDLLSAQEVGETAVQAYCKERLQQGDKDVFATLRKCNLKSFTSMVKKVKSNQKGKEIVLKSDRNLFARLLLIGSSRQVDIKEMLSYSLGIFPLSIATCEGSLVKTNKAKMMQFLEEKVDTPLYVERPPMEAAWIVDGMALLQQLKNPPATFGLLARHVLDILLNLARSNNAMYVHFVTDRYLNKSIKSAEREKRGVGGTEIFRIYSDDQSVPKQWKKFLSASTNKESLVKYVFQKWSSGDMDLHGVVIFIAHDQECHQICTTESGVECKPVPALHCNHEEADTRIFLHCSYASSVTKCNNIIIKSPDTDVMIIAVAMCSTLSTRLFFSTGVGNKKRIIDVSQVANNVGTDICSALIGFHVFTGCDSVSSFYGKGKVKCLKVLKSRPEFCNTFSSLGETFDVPNELSKTLQSFVCCLYGQTACTDVNQARLNLFRLDVRCETGMPPTQDALQKHILRANYQTAIHKLCFEQFPEVPPPISHGWKVVDDNLDIDWMDCPPAPDSVLEFVQCGCKKSKCRQRICSCVQNGLPCTDLCHCSDCDNKFAYNEVEEEEVDSDEEVI